MYNVPAFLKPTCFLLLLFIAGDVILQTPRATAQHFFWNSHTFIELDYHHTIGASKDLPASERRLLISAITTLLRPLMADFEINSEHELRELALQSRFKFIDLNDDAIPEVIVQPLGLKTGCGATGNCPFWVLSKTTHGYKTILDTRRQDGIGGIQLHRIEPQVSNTYHDISLATHDSASERTVLIYSFHRTQYKLARCYRLSWSSGASGKWKLLKAPSITACNAVR